MKFELQERSAFTICGYCMETSLETCGTDLAILWKEFAEKKEELYHLFGSRRDFYGLMWKTQNSRYCYLIGIEAAPGLEIPKGTVCKQIPAAKYAVAFVPPTQSAVDAWTEYYYTVLPNAGYIPNAAHGFDFEYYPDRDGGAYELWTPVEKKDRISDDVQ